MPTSTRFFSGQTDYIEQLNITVDEITAGGGVTSVTASTPVVSSGGTTPVISMPAATSGVNGYLTSANWTTFNNKAAISDITVTNLTGTLTLAKGGTGATSAQGAINALAAAVTSGQYLRGNGTNVIMSTIQAGDVPTLNQNTTGTASIATTVTTTDDVATATSVYPVWATAGNTSHKISTTKMSFVPSTGALTAVSFVGAGTGLTSIPNSALVNTAVASLSGTNTGDNATNSQYASDYRAANFVVRTNYAEPTTALATGLLKNTTGTGAHTIAVAGTDYLTPTGSAANLTGFPTFNQNTTGTAANITGVAAVANGGTGLSTLTSGSILVGAGTASPTLVAPSTLGNVLTSNGTTWVSSPAAGGSAITVKDEGTNLTTSLTSLDFVGAGVTASNTGGAVTVTITGGGGSGGTVTSASVVSANGFAGSVANPTTTPAITLSTTITGILSGNGTTISAASTTGSGSVVLATSPTLTTPVLGVASVTTLNKLTFTQPATGATLTIADGKTLIVNNSLTFSGTDASVLNIGTGGMLGTAAFTASSSYSPVAGSGAIATVGTITSGAWNGSVIGSAYGGTGVNNGSSTLTLGGNLSTSGAFDTTLNTTATTSVTLPVSGSLISSATQIPVITGTPTSSTYLRGDGTWDTVSGGSGTVTSVSVITANGFTGSVATPTTTPAITLSTSVNGVIKGNGTAISAATVGTDYSSGTSALATGILKSTTSTGALSIAVAGDFPTLNQNTTGTASNVTGIVMGANGGTGVNNSGKTLTLGGNHANSGAFASTFTFTGTTTVTFPTSGTISTLLGTETLSNKTLLNYKETVVALSGTTPSLTAANGTIQTWTLTGNSAPTSALTDGESITLMINDGTNFTISWAIIGVTWLGGVAPTLSTSGFNVIVIWRVAGVVYGSLIGAT